MSDADAPATEDQPVEDRPPDPIAGSSAAEPDVSSDPAAGGPDSPQPPAEPAEAPAARPYPYPIYPPPPPPPRWDAPMGPGEPSRRAGRIVAGILAGLVLLGSGIGIGWVATHGNSSTARRPIAVVQPEQPSDQQAGGPLSPQEIADKVDPAVVDINTVMADGFNRSTQAAGTGMVITSSGQVLTNNHVVEGATQIHVSVSGRDGTYTAHVVGVSPNADVALLQIDGATNLPTVTFADSSTLRIGQEVVAIGNALGRGGTPAHTEGTIDELNRSVTVSDGRGGTEQLMGLIQTDADIQPGESGGPLVNTQGQVVGMITAGSRTRFSTTSVIGFAIPSNDALHIVNEVRAGHESADIIIGPPGFLGVGVDALDEATASRLGLDLNGGVLVVSVGPGTPAAEAGIAANSVITQIDGQAVHSVDELGTAIRAHDPGEQISVTWVDQAGTHTATATLITGPAV